MALAIILTDHAVTSSPVQHVPAVVPPLQLGANLLFGVGCPPKSRYQFVHYQELHSEVAALA